MEQIKNVWSKISKEVKANKTRQGIYQAPRVPDNARFKMLVKFKPCERFNGGYKIFYSLEHIVKKQSGHIDEYAALLKLMVFYNKLKKQNRLEFAKIFMTLDEIPSISEKNHNALVAIITEFDEFFNNTLKSEIINLDTKIKLSTFVSQWLA
tara:strand:+ start:5641 stop:6096 length:456 start_codon:yes stop_codon:yes gene_type:complete